MGGGTIFNASPGFLFYLVYGYSLPSLQTYILIAIRCSLTASFLSQPFHVAENFTGVPGKYVPLKETVRGFKAIIDGEMDDYPEAAFFNVGTIDDVIEKAKTMAGESSAN